MCQHNQRAVLCAKSCLKKLTASGIQEVALYGAGDVAEILYNWTYEIPVKINVIYDDCGRTRYLGLNVLPIEEGAKGGEKVIIASLVAVEMRIKRLQRVGIDKNRIVVLE